MEGEAWRSVEVVWNNEVQPHVLQQKVSVYTAGVSEESSGYTKPEIQPASSRSRASSTSTDRARSGEPEPTTLTGG